jgi:hypothetical protein
MVAHTHRRHRPIASHHVYPSPQVTDIRPITGEANRRPRPTRWCLREPKARAPWMDTTTTKLLKCLLWTDILGTTTLSLLSNSLAPTVYVNYDSGIRHFVALCHDRGRHLPRTYDDTVHPTLHNMAWPTRHSMCGLSTILLLGGQQVFP